MSDLMSEEEREVEDRLRDYETFRELADEVEADEDYEQLCEETGLSTLRGAIEGIINTMNHNIQDIITAVYEGMRKNLVEAQTNKDRIHAIAEGKSIFDRLEAFPEHAQHPFLVKVIQTVEGFEAQLDETLANEKAARQDALFRKEMAGIEYTATEKQIKCLLSLGAKPHQLSGITKQRASAMIDSLKEFMLKISCPYCNKTLEMPDKYIALRGKCNKCGKSIWAMEICFLAVSSYCREVFLNAAEAEGIKVRSQITKNCTHAVIGKGAAQATIERAERRSMIILTPEEFLHMMPNLPDKLPPRPPSDSQLAFLERLGATYKEIQGLDTLEKASDLIDYYIQLRDQSDD